MGEGDMSNASWREAEAKAEFELVASGLADSLFAHTDLVGSFSRRSPVTLLSAAPRLFSCISIGSHLTFLVCSRAAHGSRCRWLQMSGFEVAGVVLGVIPLAISALEHYKAGKGVASSFLKWRGLLDTLIFRLKLQKTFFYLQILELLREARVPDLDDRIDLTEEECVIILRSVKTGEEVQEYLGGLYTTFQDVLERYEACLKTIVAKLGHIQRLPGVS